MLISYDAKSVYEDASFLMNHSKGSVDAMLDAAQETGRDRHAFVATVRALCWTILMAALIIAKAIDRAAHPLK